MIVDAPRTPDLLTLCVATGFQPSDLVERLVAGDHAFETEDGRSVTFGGHRVVGATEELPVAVFVVRGVQHGRPVANASADEGGRIPRRIELEPLRDEMHVGF